MINLESTILTLIFPVIFAFILFNFYKSVRYNKKKKWIILFISEIISIILAIILTYYYAFSEGDGILPGLSNLYEVFYCFFWVCVYLTFTGISFVTLIIKFILNKKKNNLYKK